MKRRPLQLTAALLPILFACRGAAPSPAPPDTDRAALAAHQALERQDGRAGVPLLPLMAQHQKENMRDHLLAVQEVVAALAQQDFPGVERAARRLGYSEEMGRTCAHMGAGAPGFTEQALHFHHTADGVSAAARQQDATAVLAALGATLHACNGCHAAFKQQVVDDATWQRLAARPTPGPQH